MLIVITDKEDNCHYCEDIQFAMNSKLIRKILWYENQEKNLPVRLPSISGEILSFIISWIKCPQSLNLEELANKDFFVCDLLLTAEYLEMPHLSKTIISWLAEKLNSENVFQLWTFGMDYNIKDLVSLCWKFENLRILSLLSVNYQ